MNDFTDTDLRGSRFQRANLSGSTFERVDLSEAQFRSCDLNEVSFRGIEMRNVRITGAQLIDVEISAELANVVINGVEVGPLIEAELDRRDPDRARMRPIDPAGFREAWDIVERRWEATIAHARGLSPETLHESVNGEWSFIETLRHLVFATDAWIRRAMLGDPAPWDPLDLPWDGMPDTPGVPRDRAARPTLDEVLELRRDRMRTVREVIDGLTEGDLDRETEPIQEPGWPPPVSFKVRECLSVILNEEYLHRQFADRDLAVLESQTT
jgi:uncharacterized damage-inducible protein DinB